MQEMDEEFLTRVGFEGRSKSWRELLSGQSPEKPKPKTGQTQTWVRPHSPVSMGKEMPRWLLTLAMSCALFLSGLAVLRMLGWW